MTMTSKPLSYAYCISSPTLDPPRPPANRIDAWTLRKRLSGPDRWLPSPVLVVLTHDARTCIFCIHHHQLKPPLLISSCYGLPQRSGMHPKRTIIIVDNGYRRLGDSSRETLASQPLRWRWCIILRRGGRDIGVCPGVCLGIPGRPWAFPVHSTCTRIDLECLGMIIGAIVCRKCKNKVRLLLFWWKNACQSNEEFLSLKLFSKIISVFI